MESGLTQDRNAAVLKAKKQLEIFLFGYLLDIELGNTANPLDAVTKTLKLDTFQCTEPWPSVTFDEILQVYQDKAFDTEEFSPNVRSVLDTIIQERNQDLST